eukprot:9315124-Pyramimonas_sp.AAC.1
MQKQGRDRANNSQSYPGYGIDKLNSPTRRGELAETSNGGLVPLVVPCLSRSERMMGAALEHLATMVPDDIMMWAFSH